MMRVRTCVEAWSKALLIFGGLRTVHRCYQETCGSSELSCGNLVLGPYNSTVILVAKRALRLLCPSLSLSFCLFVWFI